MLKLTTWSYIQFLWRIVHQSNFTPILLTSLCRVRLCITWIVFTWWFVVDVNMEVLQLESAWVGRTCLVLSWHDVIIVCTPPFGRANLVPIYINFSYLKRTQLTKKEPYQKKIKEPNKPLLCDIYSNCRDLLKLSSFIRNAGGNTWALMWCFMYSMAPTGCKWTVKGVQGDATLHLGALWIGCPDLCPYMVSIMMCVTSWNLQRCG